MIIEFYGGPIDGQTREVPDDTSILAVREYQFQVEADGTTVTYERAHERYNGHVRFTIAVKGER
jgi:hypothetical protein